MTAKSHQYAVCYVNQYCVLLYDLGVLQFDMLELNALSHCVIWAEMYVLISASAMAYTTGLVQPVIYKCFALACSSNVICQGLNFVSLVTIRL